MLSLYTGSFFRLVYTLVRFLDYTPFESFLVDHNVDGATCVTSFNEFNFESVKLILALVIFESVNFILALVTIFHLALIATLRVKLIFANNTIVYVSQIIRSNYSLSFEDCKIFTFNV